MLAAVAVSCSKEKELESKVEPQEEGIQVTIVAGNPETKTALSGGSESVWTDGDELGVMKPGIMAVYTFAENSIDSGTATTATFVGSVGSAGTHYAVHPVASGLTGGNEAMMEILAEQNPANASFDSESDILVSKSFEVSSVPATISGLQFKRLTSVLKVTLSDGSSAYDFSSEHIKSLTVTSSAKNLAGLVLVDLDDQSMCAPYSNQSKSVTANYAGSGLALNGTNSVYLVISPVTLASGESLTITAETEHFKINKVKDLTADIAIAPGRILPINFSVADADVTPKAPALERVWGFYSDDVTGWYATTNITAVSIAHPDGYGMARGLAMDDDYIYLPKSSAYANIAAVSIADKATQKAVNKTGVSGGSTFATSFVRMIKNDNPSVNGGKDVLLLCNLTATDSDENQLRLYAYKDGVDSAPTKIAAFCYDAANDTNDWRRYGDRFFVTGTWADGKVYFPSYNANKTVVLSIANGARTAVTQIAAGAANSPDGIKDVAIYPGDDELFLTNGSIANLVTPTGSKTAQGWDEYVLDSSSANGVGTWGYNFFQFEGKDYIAYARISGSKAWIEVIEDKGDLLTSLADQDGLLKSPIHSASNLDATHATGGVADCCVRVIDGVVYIAALTRDGGLVLDRMVLK